MIRWTSGVLAVKRLLPLLLVLALPMPLVAFDEFITGGDRTQADADYAANRYEQAQIGYERWLEHNPRDAEAWFRLGNLYTQRVRPMDALVAYRKAQMLRPEDGRAWHNMGMLYLRLATESYDNLRRNVPPDDPLVPYSEKVLSGILDLIAVRINGGELSPLKPLAPKSE